MSSVDLGGFLSVIDGKSFACRSALRASVGIAAAVPLAQLFWACGVQITSFPLAIASAVSAVVLQFFDEYNAYIWRAEQNPSSLISVPTRLVIAVLTAAAICKLAASQAIGIGMAFTAAFVAIICTHIIISLCRLDV